MQNYTHIEGVTILRIGVNSGIYSLVWGSRGGWQSPFLGTIVFSGAIIVIPVGYGLCVFSYLCG